MPPLRAVRRAAPREPATAGPTPAALKSRALRWLAQRDHSRAELERKLLTHARALARLAEAAVAAGAPDGPTSAASAGAADEPALAVAPAPSDDPRWPEPLLRERVAAVVERLVQAGLIDEPRMAESLLAAKAGRYGARRLRQVMQQRGFAAEQVDAAAAQAAQAHGSEFDRAHALWQRRFGRAPADVAERLRQMRFLAGRGFDAEVVRRVLRRAGDDEADAGFAEGASGDP